MLNLFYYVNHEFRYFLPNSYDKFNPKMERVLEGHLKKILIELNIIPNNEEDCIGTATDKEINYINRCYTFYHENRHILEHWDDPTFSFINVPKQNKLRKYII